MDNECKTCGSSVSFPHYRVVQTLYEMNTLPCNERVNGMMVTVVGADSSFKQFMLKGGDPCNNSNWIEVSSLYLQNKKSGHVTIIESPTSKITSTTLNSQFPESTEGFRVTFTAIDTTFMKVKGDVWVMTNNISIDYE